MTTHSLNRPSDVVVNGPPLVNASLADFWQWTLADLCDDDVKGFFAEWLVHKLLNVESARRVSWANSDLVTPDGVTLEIKATAYWQSWKVLDEFGKPRTERKYGMTSDSAIRFGGLRARDASTVADMRTLRTLKSHLYVLAFQHEKDIPRWNAMDLSQWEFYVLAADQLSRLSSGRTVSLTKLRSVQQPLTAQEFVATASQLIKLVGGQRNAV